MTKSQLIEEMSDHPDNIEVRVEFGIDHHVPIERIDEEHPDGETSKENYLLLIL